jgi:hypothetical protein
MNLEYLKNVMVKFMETDDFEVRLHYTYFNCSFDHWQYLAHSSLLVTSSSHFHFASTLTRWNSKYQRQTSSTHCKSLEEGLPFHTTNFINNNFNQFVLQNAVLPKRLKLCSKRTEKSENLCIDSNNDLSCKLSSPTIKKHWF